MATPRTTDPGLSDHLADLFARFLTEMPDQERRELLAASSSQARRNRKSGNDPRYYGSPRDSLVQKLAADQLRLLHDRKSDQMSFRDIADSYGVSYERVRQLYIKLVDPNYVEVAPTPRP